MLSMSVRTPVFSLYSATRKHVVDYKINFVYLSADERETQLAFRKHFDHQLELYKTVVSFHN